MPEPQPIRQHFSPWTANDQRSCWTCRHAIGYDGVHLWCQLFRLVVVDQCARWEREAGCDAVE